MQDKFKPKDIVSTKPHVYPWRGCEEVEQVRFAIIRGEDVPNAVFVKGLPYCPDELILELPWVE